MSLFTQKKLQELELMKAQLSKQSDKKQLDYPSLEKLRNIFWQHSAQETFKMDLGQFRVFLKKTQSQHFTKAESLFFKNAKSKKLDFEDFVNCIRDLANLSHSYLSDKHERVLALLSQLEVPKTRLDSLNSQLWQDKVNSVCIQKELRQHFKKLKFIFKAYAQKNPQKITAQEFSLLLHDSQVVPNLLSNFECLKVFRSFQSFNYEDSIDFRNFKQCIGTIGVYSKWKNSEPFDSILDFLRELQGDTVYYREKAFK